jgi:hypothetical protein
MERSESDSSLFKYATSTSELLVVMQVVVKTSEKHYCRCQKYSAICGEGKVAVQAPKSYEGIAVFLHCLLTSLGGESAIVFKLQPPYREKCTR